MAYESYDSSDTKRYSDKDKGKLFAWGGYILITLGAVVAIVLCLLYGWK